MVQQAIYESDVKKILKRNIQLKNVIIQNHVVVENIDFVENIRKECDWLDGKLVTKPDQCVKGRGLAGLVALNLDWNQVVDWIANKIGKNVKVGSVEGVLKRFIVEPMVNHTKEEEHFLCICSAKNIDRILYSSHGGVDIGNVHEHSTNIDLKVDEELKIEIILSSLLGKCENRIKSLLSIFILELFKLFRDLHFTYLELNPMIISDSKDVIYIVDVAAKVDTCADFVCEQDWGLLTYPPTFGRELLLQEKHIAELDANSGSSLKFVVLNKSGKIWTMVAGGGASVVFSDTICDLGYSSELANYGEYSGAPTEEETYEYAHTILNLIISTPRREDGKVLIIGGGIANFTNVASTFKGIIRAIEVFHKSLVDNNVKIFVRRGGPNYLEAMKNIYKSCTSHNVPIFVFGINVHMTSIVAMALGLEPISNTINFNTEALSKCQNSSASQYRELSESKEIAESLSPSSIFDDKTTAIMWGLQENAVQGMLDFDYLCRRKTHSLVCIIYPFRASSVAKFYFGLKEIVIPIFGTFKEATYHYPDASVFINFASHRSSYGINLEAIKCKQFKIISTFAEGVPERYTQQLNRICYDKGIQVIGPASIGGIKPGSFRIGHAGGSIENIISSKLYRPGSVSYITRSGGMSNELNNILSQITDGVYEGIHIGGDRYPGSSFMDHIERFNSYSQVQLIVILGEVGGLEEYSICEALKAGKIQKPLVAWCIGTCSTCFQANIQFGHANACADALAETASAKNKALREAGACVPDSFNDFPNIIERIYKEQTQKGIWITKPDVKPLPIPIDHKIAKEAGMIRVPTNFITSICDDRGSEPVYAGYSVTKILEKNLGVGGTIGLLWFKKALPPYMIDFLELCMIILADHGPAVSGAHNTIVTARAGKDMITSLCTGLMTIGDKFGGAINGAAEIFWNAYCSKLLPGEFVKDMREKGILIPGIGHLVKSIKNPDERVKKLIEYARQSQIATPLLNYALEVEKITTSKKANLILNVDGTIAVILIDMMIHSKLFSPEDVNTYIKIGTFNGIFIISRSIGFIGHFIDQKRLKQGLYRHPWDDIAFFSEPTL